MKATQKLDKEGMRQNNLRLIFETVYRQGGITRAQLAAKTGMSAMAVGRIVDYLAEQGLLVERDAEAQNGLGRPARRLALNRAEIFNVGVSLDVDGAFIGKIDPYGKILARDSLRFDQASPAPAATLDRVAAFILGFLRAQGIEGLPALGLVMPGIIDPAAGVLRLASQLRWQDVPVAAMLEAHPGMPKVVLDNDVKARAQAENRFGEGVGCPVAVVLTIGSGIGAGVVVDDEVYRGKDNMAGEIGHIAIHTNSRMCECGRSGCLQAIITDSSLLSEARAVCPDIDLAGFVEACRREEPWAGILLGQFTGAVMTTVDLLANTYAPDAIIFCGSLMDRFPYLREVIRARIEAGRAQFLNYNFDIRFSRFGPDGNMVGAATAAFNHNIGQLLAASPVEGETA